LSEEKKKNLWYDFDNWSQFAASPSIREAIESIFLFLAPRKWPFGTLTSETLAEELNSEAGKVLINSANKLIPGYLEKFGTYFGPNFDEERPVIDSFPWDAFVHFGLGVLHDPRPPRIKEYSMHVMDSGNFGYFLWHRFNWIAHMLNRPEHPFAIGNWLYLDRLLGLAAELHSTSKPNQSNSDGSPPDNPPNGGNISIDEIRTISERWLDLGFEEIEQNLSQLQEWVPTVRREDQLSQDPRIFTSRVHHMV
jgi:hypothetical protein